MFSDRVLYREKVVEISNRYGLIEYNEVYNSVRVVRMWKDGCFSVASSNRLGYRELETICSKALGRCDSKVGWFNGEYYRGSVSVGAEADKEELEKLVSDIARWFSEKGVSVEVVLVYGIYDIEHDIVSHGIGASEKRVLYELYIYPHIIYYGRPISRSIVLVANDLHDLYGKASYTLEKMYRSLLELARAKRLNPIYSGKWYVILYGTSAPALVHEIAHYLQGDEPVKLSIGYRFSTELTVLEDPFYRGPLRRVFDDEVYPAWRRVLIESGEVVDYLHTRTTVNGRGRPGNARGLFTLSKPMHHQLVVRQGDWGFEEMVFESRRSVVVGDIAVAYTGNGYIWIIPEEAWIAKKDSTTPVRVQAVLVPLSRVNEVFIGVGKGVFERFSYEKNRPIYEVSPPLLIEGRVIA